MSYENQLIREMTDDTPTNPDALFDWFTGCDHTQNLSLKHGEGTVDATLAEEKESLFSKESDKLFEHAPTPKEAEDFE